MSSLLSNDFVEEFFRVEKNLTTNFQRFHIDRTSKLIFTTPFELDKTITTNKKIELESNLASKNVNIIMDSIVLLSSNPDIQNFLPLKISLGNSDASKPVYEFSNYSTSTTLNNYRIIVDPPININTITNARYARPANFSVNTELDFEKIVNVVQCQNLIFFLVDVSAGDNFIIKYNLDTGIYDSVPMTDAGRVYGPIQIYANNRQAVALVEEVSPSIGYRFFDLLTGTTITDIIIELLNESIHLFRNNLIYWTLPGGNDFVNIYIKNNLNVPYVHSYLNLYNFSFTPIPIIGLYSLNKYATFSINSKKFGYKYQNFSNQSIVNLEVEYLQDIDGKIIAIYFGGSNIDKPIFNVFTKDDSTTEKKLRWYRFPYEYWEALQLYWNTLALPASQRTQPPISIIPVVLDEDLPINFILKRYSNNGYYTNKLLEVVLLNLDTGEVLKYVDDTIINRPLPELPILTNFSDYGYIICGIGVIATPLVERNKIVSTYYINERYNLDAPFEQVYKVSYNFSERINPYYLTDNFVFTIKLPNNTPVADMEIFKYIFDFRIRYDKSDIRLDEAKAKNLDAPQFPIADEQICIDECDEEDDDKLFSETPIEAKSLSECKDKECFIKKDKRANECKKKCAKIGSASRVLGYVGEDFNVEDFLNIYSTR